MEYQKLPLVIKDYIFKNLFISLDRHNFFIEILKLRTVSREFKFFFDRFLRKFFNLQIPSPYKNIETKLDAKSVFLRDRLTNCLELDIYKTTEIERDYKDGILCSICNQKLHSESYLVRKVDRINNYGYSIYDYYISEISCWECYKNIYGSSEGEHIKFEDNIKISSKVNDFYDIFVN
jgi:hypothetical protein